MARYCAFYRRRGDCPGRFCLESMMDKDVADARKLANKVVASCMESPLPIDKCITVLAHIVIDFAITNHVPIEVIMHDFERLYKIIDYGKEDQSGAVH